jgi:hypothetical protein
MPIPLPQAHRKAIQEIGAGDEYKCPAPMG